MAAYAEPPDALKELSRAWWLLLLVGLMCGAAGVIVLAQPDISLATLAVIAGIFLLVDGIYDIVVAIAEDIKYETVNPGIGHHCLQHLKGLSAA